MMKICVLFILGLMIGCIAGGGTKVYWKVLERIEKYGDDLTLMCKLNETLQTSLASMRWYKGETLCSFNNGTSNITKYEAVPVHKGVKLTILNLDREDVNIKYHCENGFDQSEKCILSEEMVFREKKVPVKSYQSVNVTVIIVSVLGVLMLVGLLGFLWMNMKKGYIGRSWKHLHRRRGRMLGTYGNNPTRGQSYIENGEVIDLLLNGESNGERNSCHNESEDVVQNGDTRVPLVEMVPESDADETLLKVEAESSQNGPNGVLQINDNSVASEANQVNAESIQNRPEAVLPDDGITTSPPVVIQKNAAYNIPSPSGKYAALPQNGSTTEVALPEDVTDSIGEQNDITDSKILHCEPNSSGFLSNQPDRQATTRFSSTITTYRGSEFTPSDATGNPSPSLYHRGKREYRKIDMRINSFNASRFSFSSPSIPTLADAGFFYLGHENYAKCYACENWHKITEGEDPTDSQFHEADCEHLKAKKSMQNFMPEGKRRQ